MQYRCRVDTLYSCSLHKCVSALLDLSVLAVSVQHPSVFCLSSLFFLPVHLASVSALLYFLSSPQLILRTCPSCHGAPCLFCLSVCLTPLLPVRIVGKPFRRSLPLSVSLSLSFPLNPFPVVNPLTSNRPMWLFSCQ